MACEHKRLKSVNCVIMCADCGAVMPRQYAAGGETTGTSSVSADALPPSPTRSESFRAEGKAFGETTEEETTSFVTPQSGATPSPEGEGKGDAAETTEPKKRGRKKKEA